MNVILCLMDTLRRDHLGCYGNPWIRTPNLDRFAGMSTLFEHAYLGSYPCMPARREIWTGCREFPWRGWGPLEQEDQPFIATLGAAGRPTMLVTDHYHFFEHGSGNYHLPFGAWEFVRGNEADAWVSDPEIAVAWPAPEFTKVHRKWAQYYRNTARWRRGGCWQEERHTFAAQTFQAAASWIERNRSTRDFFLMIDCFDPHEPFDPPAPYDRLYNANPPAQRVRWPIYGPADRYTREELADIRALYAGKVTLVDTWFGRFLETLERQGRLADTLIVVTTDHGHLFGEHGMIGKPSTRHGDSNLYEEVAHIPLLIYHPERSGGRRERALVQHIDLAPTILEAAGVSAAAAGMHGRSLLPLLRGEQARVRDYALFGKFGEAVNITDGEWVLFQWPPAGENTPLHWYSPLRPEFLKPRGVGPFDPATASYPVDYERGPMTAALYHLPTDPRQQCNRIGTDPAQAARLRHALSALLQEIDAPAEQRQRLNLPD